jgi:RNA polymerase sigma-70 factor (ECF subfamily)
VSLDANRNTTSDELYARTIAEYGSALGRLACAYEADIDKRRDLIQEVHIALWRSFRSFEEKCSLRTWIYRVAHHAAISHVIRQRRSKTRSLMSLEEIEAMPDDGSKEYNSDRRIDAERLLKLVHQLKPIDRQLMLLYLEDLDAASIGEITGISAGSVRVQIHRIKAILARRFHQGAKRKRDSVQPEGGAL